jgi:hypothetical protein
MLPDEALVRMRNREKSGSKLPHSKEAFLFARPLLP